MTSLIDEALARLVGRHDRPEQLFETAVELLTGVTGWRFAAVGALNAAGKGVDILAASQDGEAQPNWSYDLAGTPCCDVYDGTIEDPYWFVAEGLAEKYPDDKPLAERGFTAYRGELFFDDHGNAAGHVFMMHDRPTLDEERSRWFFRLITQRIGAEYNRMRMEQTLATQQDRYGRATAAGNVGIWEWNLDTGAVYFAPNLERMLGCAEGEHIRHIDDWRALTDPASSERMTRAAESLRTGKIDDEMVAEYSVVMADGTEHWFEARAHILGEPDGRNTTLVGTDTDITARKQIEIELMIAKELAEQANRSKSEFLATMSHEFRTPLNAILGFSDLMLSGVLGPLQNPAYEEYISDILKSGTLMLSLVNDILDIAAIEAGKREIVLAPTSIAELLETALRTARTLAGAKALTISVDIPADLPALNADERAITQIVNNLLSNAVKFTNAGGQVTVSARYRGPSFELSVSDTGCGIPPEKLEIVATPFSQVHANPHLSEHGTGLGLAIVKSLTELHGGTLAIESEVGVGTRVTIALPIASNVITASGI